MASRYGVRENGVLSRFDPTFGHIWGLSILFFGVGDVISTAVGLGTAGLAEVGPLAAPVIEHYGLWALVALKLVTFAVCYSLWRATPHPHRIGVPLGLATLGVLVTAWNTLLILLTL